MAADDPVVEQASHCHSIEVQGLGIVATEAVRVGDAGNEFEFLAEVARDNQQHVLACGSRGEGADEVEGDGVPEGRRWREGNRQPGDAAGPDLGRLAAGAGSNKFFDVRV